MHKEGKYIDKYLVIRTTRAAGIKAKQRAEIEGCSIGRIVEKAIDMYVGESEYDVEALTYQLSRKYNISYHQVQEKLAPLIETAGPATGVIYIDIAKMKYLRESFEHEMEN